MTVDPVVVMPEVDSNTASARLRSRSPRTKGSAPNRHTSAQATVVKMKACRTEKTGFLVRVVMLSVSPAKPVIAADATNARQAGLPCKASKAAGTIIATARMPSR